MILAASIILLISFYALAVLTEDYFVPALDIIANKMKLSSDASGATLLAMGSSAPEFFTSLIAVLGLAGSGHADIGAGTIVGSAIFNILVIVGLTALFSVVRLQWKPILRDLVFYIVTILLLLWSFWDGHIDLHEAIVFVLVYALYVYAVVNWRKWLHYRDESAPTHNGGKPRNKVNIVFHTALSYVIPNPVKKPKWYIVSFWLSIIGIAGLSWVLVQQAVIIADGLAINPTFVALTILAAGTSIPDLIGSIVVAKQGRGDMAVSNAIGSNVFDILFGLGVPWILVLGIRGGSISVGTENLTASVYLLFATVVATLVLLVVRRWKIGQKSGLLLLAMYVIYCVYIIKSL